MMLQIANMHLAFGMKWIMTHERSEIRRVKSEFNSKGNLYVCQALSVSGGQSGHQAWIGVYGLDPLAHSIPKSKEIHSAALCMAALVKDAIVLQPLAKGCVWLCVIKAGMPVVGFDLLISPQEIQSHLEFCQRVFKKSGAQTQPGGDSELCCFEVIEAFDLLKLLETKKIKDKAIATNFKAARLRPLHSKGWSKFRPIALALSAAGALCVLMGLALGGDWVEVVSNKMGFSVFQSSSMLAGAFNQFQLWLNTEFFPEHERQEAIRLARLALQTQEAQSARDREQAESLLRVRAHQFELNAKRFVEQQHQLRSKVSPIEFWMAFNRVRQSVPISLKGLQMRHMKCVPVQCDLDWSKGEARFQKTLISLPHQEIDSNSMGESEHTLNHLDLKLEEMPLEFSHMDSFQSFMQSVKEHFGRVPMNWGESSALVYSLDQGESAVRPSPIAKAGVGRVNTQGDKWLIAKTGEWSLNLTGETMLVQGDEFVKLMASWPMELSELNYLKNESLSFKGRWFYFAKEMSSP